MNTECTTCNYANEHGWWGDSRITHCRDCHRTWSSLRQAHCRGRNHQGRRCCEHFASATGSDYHQATGEAEQVLCLPPATVLDSEGRPRYVAVRGVWHLSRHRDGAPAEPRADGESSVSAPVTEPEPPEHDSPTTRDSKGTLTSTPA